MRQVLLHAAIVGCGGFLGSVLRYCVGLLLERPSASLHFPLGTLTVNLVGCALIGAAAGWSDTRQLLSPEVRAFGVIGILGGFTTFSSFGMEAFSLLREGEPLRAGVNVVVQVAVGLLFVWLGYLAISRS